MRTSMRTSKKRKNSGFTLLEMLAVVTILGIIAAVVVPRFSSFSDTSKTSVALHHMAQLNAIIERHYIDADGWPADLAELVTDGYIDAVPVHPDSNFDYSYSTTTNRVTAVAAS